VKAVTLFAAATAGLIGVAWLLLGLGFSSQADGRALRTSAAVALVVQIATFVFARQAGERNLMVGWALGSVLRVLALVAYALLVVPALGLPRSAALMSLVTFLFVSMLVEPLLLAYDR